MAQDKHEVLPGTLNLLVLKTLGTIGPLHAKWSVSENNRRAKFYSLTVTRFLTPAEEKQ
jgi:hypothetical protein